VRFVLNTHWHGDHTHGNAVVHLGDNFFNGMFPFVDLESGGSTRGMVTAVEQVLAQVKPDTKVIPGHGPIATVEELRAYSSSRSTTT
jgi:glyoxylase-like metal-dependent hydrolase (beta-lactamase superfamily II)